jgi:GNAT superfamily N-acetyltransferase
LSTRRPSIDEILKGEGKRLVIRELDERDRFERELVIESCVKARQPRDVGFRHWQETHEPIVQTYVESTPVLMAVVEPTPGPSIVLGFAVATPELVRMVYVKRDYRAYGLGLRLLTAARAARNGVVTAGGWAPTRGWRPWLRALEAKRTLHAANEAA